MLRLTSVVVVLLLAYGLMLDMFEGVEFSKSATSWQLWIGSLLAASAAAVLIETMVGSVLARKTGTARPRADVRLTIASCIAGGLAVVSLILARIIN